MRNEEQKALQRETWYSKQRMTTRDKRLSWTLRAQGGEKEKEKRYAKSMNCWEYWEYWELEKAQMESAVDDNCGLLASETVWEDKYVNFLLL